MGQNEKWPGAWSAQIGARIRDLRDVAGLSAQKLSDRCQELGHAIPRSTIANIESGRKESIPVHEVAVIAKALEVPPVALLFPLDQEAEVEALPGRVMSPWSGWQWFTGQDQDIRKMTEASAASRRIAVFLDVYTSLSNSLNQWIFLEDMRSEFVRLEGPEALAKQNPHIAEAMGEAVEQIAKNARTLERAGLGLPHMPAKLSAAVRQSLIELMSSSDG